jgi:DNA polymerase-3 subunit chi
MTRIDFHFNITDTLSYACRLARKVRAQDHQLVIYASDPKWMESLDQGLWSMSDLDFLPHCYASDPLASVTPILLATEVGHSAHHDVLINLDPEQPAFFSRFERMIELIATDENAKIAGRNRWRFYQNRGYALTRYDAAEGSA